MQTCLSTCVKISSAEVLQDVVHGSHVEDETQLSHTHCHQTQHEQRAENTLHERLSCKEEKENRDSQNYLLTCQLIYGSVIENFYNTICVCFWSFLVSDLFKHCHLLSSLVSHCSSRSMVDRQSFWPSLASSFCLWVLSTLRRLPTVVTWL